MNLDAKDKLYSLIDHIKVGMLVTQAAEGRLHGRPLHTVEMDASGALWFFIAADSEKRLEADAHGGTVNISYADVAKQNYVSISGHASIVRDTAKMRQFWSPWIEVWFPKGVDDPNLALLKVQIESAEYWDAPGNTVTRVLGFVRAIYGDKTGLGDHQKIEMT